MLEEQQGGQCGGNRVSKGQIEEGTERLTGWGGSCGAGWAFVISEVRSQCRVLSRVTDLTYFLK